MPFGKQPTKVPCPIFIKEPIHWYCERKLRELQEEVEKQNLDYILGVNQADYAQYLIDHYSIGTPVLDFSNAHSSWEERDVLDEYKYVIICTVPITGDFSYLKYKPDNCTELLSQLESCRDEGFYPPSNSYGTFITLNTYYFFRLNSLSGEKDLIKKYSKEEIQALVQKPQDIRFHYEITLEELKNALDDADMLAEPYFHLEIVSREKSGNKEEARKILNSVKSCAKLLAQQIKEFNSEVKRLAPQLIRERRKRILKNEQTLKSIGLPIKRRDNLPETYTIPTPNFRKSVTVMPPVTDKVYAAEPTLEEKTYVDILQTIHDVGKVFERLPSTYSNRHEEDLRDLFLLYLEPRYEGSATGETFNVSGKTDILIRHKNSNAFIAECKFWAGPKEYLDAITQLLSYLTWRDSKAAIILFARTKSISSVIQTVKDTTAHHPNYLGFVNEKEQSWLNYRFHIINDRNREVKLAVLIFHFRPVGDNGDQIRPGTFSN